MTPMDRLETELTEARQRIAELEYLLAKQSKAVKRGMDAAQAVAGSELEQAKRLHAECNPRALDSERAANAELTELVAVLEHERDELAAHVERLRGAMNEASDKHIAFAKRIMQGIDSTAMAAVDKADELLVREGYNAPVDTASLARRDLLKQAEALGRLAERKQRESDAEDDPSLKAQQAYAAVCAANESNKLQQQAERVRKDESPT